MGPLAGAAGCLGDVLTQPLVRGEETPMNQNLYTIPGQSNISNCNGADISSVKMWFP